MVITFYYISFKNMLRFTRFNVKLDCSVNDSKKLSILLPTTEALTVDVL